MHRLFTKMRLEYTVLQGFKDFFHEGLIGHQVT